MQQLSFIDAALFSKKRILITGASGFIGSRLTTSLCEAGAEVHGTSRIPRAGKYKNMTWWQGALEDLDVAERLLKTVKPHIIFHMAGEVTAANELKYVLPTYHSLLTSTINLLTIATDIGCERIVLTGSSTEPLDDYMIPNSPYAATKWATNGYGKMFYNLYKSPVVIARPFMGYGPGQPEYKLIPYIILSLLKKEQPKLSNGLWITDWVYIEDTVKGILACATTPGIEGETLDLGSGTLTSVREIVEKIIDIIEPEVRPQFGTIPDRHHEHTRTANTLHTSSKLKWKADTSIDQGLRATVEWFKNNYEFA
ncbi:MAG TPA: NAD(P)-dependent oxidoreductase [Segetibacter sp.]|jgi:nucleoside-diphosphate-sugar epimerase